MDAIREYIYEQVAAHSLSKEKAKELLIELKQKEEGLSAGIAVIGMSCRFAAANNVSEYWDYLKNAKSAIANLPEERIALLQAGGKCFDKNEIENFWPGGFLKDIDLFDPEFFRISPREAEVMHPAQRIILQTAYEALEDGGYTENKIRNTKTGVYIGIDSTFNSQYKELVSEGGILPLTGSVTGILAGRISYVFGLVGPNMVIDTACSSGATAVHVALNALKSGECNMAIAGGINISVFPEGKSQRTEIESVSGKLKAFDRDAKGTVWGEGAGVVLLKPLKNAVRDRDNIYAVIKGSAVNSDGASNGITSPNAEAQSDVIEKAWKSSGVNPETISYIETHGTGTFVGDPIEIKGISNAFGKYTNKKQFCGIGSVKCNIGHTVGASGLASLIKVILSMKHRELPASINFDRPNQYIDFCSTPVYVNDTHRKWNSRSFPIRAGVSAFGLSGTNCHIVLEEAAVNNRNRSSSNVHNIFNLSAKSKEALITLIERYTGFLDQYPETDADDLCYTVNVGRGHYRHRLSILFCDIQELKSILKRLAAYKRLEALKSDNEFYSEVNVVQDQVLIKLNSDITQSEINKISSQINAKIQEAPISMGLLEEVKHNYLRGADIDWEQFYKDSTAVKISLPLYPFNNRHFWSKRQESHDAPLIEKCLSNSVYEIVYSTVFKTDRHWVLSDHVISGKSVLPGTAYLEMARLAVENSFDESVWEIKNVVFLTPLVCYDNTPIEAHTVIKKNNNQLSFALASKSKENDEWVIHAEGNIDVKNKLQTAWIDIDKIKLNLNETYDTGNPEGMGRFKFGPRWWNIGKTLVGEGEALAELCLPEKLMSDINEYKLHPALMDNAVNVLVLNNEENLYLPFSYGSIKIHSRLPGRFYSYVKSIPKEAGSNEICMFDIILADENGKIIIEINDYCVKKVPNPDSAFNKTVNGGMFHQIGWIRDELSSETKEPVNKNVVLFKGDGDLSREVHQKLSRLDNSVVEVVKGDCFRQLDNGSFCVGNDIEDYFKLFNALHAMEIDYIIHMFTADHGNVDKYSYAEDELKWGVYSLFYITKAVIQCRISQRVGILLVSGNASIITQNEQIIRPCNAAFLALGSVMGQEHPNLLCRGIEVDEKTSAEKILSEIDLPYKQYMAAYRNNERYSRVIKAAPIIKISENQAELKENGVYIITGGVGGIGLEIAKYLSSLKNIRLILVNRTKIPERESWEDTLRSNKDARLTGIIKAIREIEQKGSSVRLYNADVADRQQMHEILREVRTMYGGIHGIIHSAGVAGDGFLMRKAETTFTEVIAPKIYGTKILDELTVEDKLDFFVMFSSTAAFQTDKGQGDYAAANAYQDAFALYRCMLGRKTLSINWPAWKDTGMAVEYGVNTDGDIFRAIDSKTAVSAFGTVLGLSVGNVIISEINSSDYTAKGRLPLTLPEKSHKTETTDTKEYLHVEVGDRNKVKLTGRINGKYTPIEIEIAQAWGKVLGLTEISIHSSFHSLGGDSIHSIQLYKLLEGRFGEMLDITDVFDYPTISRLAEFLVGKSRDDSTPKSSIDSLLDQVEMRQIPINKTGKII